uniref:DUF148 domain-containing protein n=1 Tax=Rhabditophanes sp. KR3021 TaxID=114890 RepID=A0AC35TVS4_9BILA
MKLLVVLILASVAALLYAADTDVKVIAADLKGLKDISDVVKTETSKLAKDFHIDLDKGHPGLKNNLENIKKRIADDLDKFKIHAAETMKELIPLAETAMLNVKNTLDNDIQNIVAEKMSQSEDKKEGISVVEGTKISPTI